MMYLEMSRDIEHGGGTWAFPNCVWAPTEKDGGGSWPFWNKILKLKDGDIVIHLRGIPPNAFFVGYSFVAGDGFETEKRPPNPKAWSYTKTFYRADLTDFTPFHTPINLNEVFEKRQPELEAYFDMNKDRDSEKLNIFYVRQAGHLQCLNGAYLSDVDYELFTALFDQPSPTNVPPNPKTPATVETGSQLATIKARVGQAEFSDKIKGLYGNTCCFPGCNVTDRRFLIGAHIARWSDNETLRGNLGNGLCLCVIHDKAFEIGIFTLDENYQVYVNPRERNSKSPIVQEILEHSGEQIRLTEILPLDDALLEHWIRIDVTP